MFRYGVDIIESFFRVSVILPFGGWRPLVGDLLEWWCVRRGLGEMGILEKIAEIEKEIARTQKNKG